MNKSTLQGSRNLSLFVMRSTFAFEKYAFIDILLIYAYLKISSRKHYHHYCHYPHYRHHSYNNHQCYRLLWCTSTKQTITRSLFDTSGYTNHRECFLSSLWLDCVPIQGPADYFFKGWSDYENGFGTRGKILHSSRTTT